MSSESHSLKVLAGLHNRKQSPVSFLLPEPLRGQKWELSHPDGSTLALQMLSDVEAVFILPELPTGDTLTLTLQPLSEESKERANRVVLLDDGNALSMEVGGSLLTTYHYADVPARPYFYPLLTTKGSEVTRAYPMRTDVPGESKDHPHHRSLWIAFGEVNGTDNWSEAPGHGSTRHEGFLSCTGGEVCGRFETMGTWLSAHADPLLTQRLQVTTWATSGEWRILDFTIDLTAEQNSVLFGDTKEGGILSVRVVGTMDVPRGGHIENSYGGLEETETWGKSAHWCDYSGPVGDGIAGIAVMDHPLSFRYPTHWHVRNYGLMTANPFGYAAYTGGMKRGEHRLAKGETLHFRYRLVVHAGNATEGDIRGRYLDFVSPPQVKVTLAE